MPTIDPNSSTWEEACRSYKLSRQTLPWKPEDFESLRKEGTYRHVTRYEMSRKEREYDPVLGLLRDGDKESKKKETESQALAYQRKRARSLQMAMGQRYDIINNELYPDGKPSRRPVIKEKAKDSFVPYNIVNNIKHNKQKDILTVSRQKIAPGGTVVYEQEQNDMITPRDVTLVDGKYPFSHNKKEFDIITNKYHHNHDARQSWENELNQDELKVRYVKTHDYDPITIKYYDPKKEEKFQSQLKTQQKYHGKAKIARLPTTTTMSEGFVYDIVNHDVKHEDKWKVMKAIQMRSYNGKKGDQIQKAIREKGLKLQDEQEERRLKRINAQRFDPEVKRGYNPINHISFKGEDSSCPPPNVATKPQSIWSKLTNGKPNLNYELQREAMPNDVEKSPLLIKKPNNSTNTITTTKNVRKQEGSPSVVKKSSVPVFIDNNQKNDNKQQINTGTNNYVTTAPTMLVNSSHNPKSSRRRSSSVPKLKFGQSTPSAVDGA